MNSVTISGNITADPVLRYTQGENSLAYTKFILAVRRKGKDNEADFVSCQAWKKTAELIEKYVKKGDKIGVEGFLRTGQYEKDGHKVYTTDVVVETVEFFGKAEKKPEKKESAEKKDETPEGFAKLDEDFPF